MTKSSKILILSRGRLPASLWRAAAAAAAARGTKKKTSSNGYDAMFSDCCHIVKS